MDFKRLINENCSPSQLSGLTLAYIGDAVYELYVRTKVLEKTKNAHQMNLEATKVVNHLAQAKLLESLEDSLSEEERLVVRRGKNAKGIVPKNAKMINYRKATAFEALVGYLYLKGDEIRLLNLLQQIEGFKEDAQ